MNYAFWNYITEICGREKSIVRNKKKWRKTNAFQFTSYVKQPILHVISFRILCNYPSQLNIFDCQDFKVPMFTGAIEERVTWNDFCDGLNLRLRVNSAKNIAFNCPKLAKRAIFKPHNFTKMITSKIFFY